MYDFLIVGAGLYGATFARCVADRGFSCVVIDKRKHVAGNAYTEPHDDYFIHKYGPHIFHTDSEDVMSFIKRFAELNHYMHQPIAEWGGVVYNLPFNMNTFKQMFGTTTPDSAKKHIAQEIKAAKIRSVRTLEDQAISMVGTTIYERLICGYTEKQWGKPCDQLPPSIIKRLPLRWTYDNRYFDDRYQGIPVSGYTEMVKNMLSGIDVRLRTDFFASRDEAENAAKVIVFTGPIDAFFGHRNGALEYRSLRFDERHLSDDNFQGTAVKNSTSFLTPWTRVVEHKHFTGSTCKGTVLTYEYSRPASTTEEPFYPVNDEKNMKLYAAYRNDARYTPNVIFGGRLGQYRYMDMDDVIEQALIDANEAVERMHSS